MIQMPPVIQMRSTNFSPTPIKHDLFRWHFMQGGFDGSCAWLCDPRANASVALCVKADGSKAAQLVALNQKAWDAVSFNGRGIGLEIEGFTEKGMSDTTLNAAALIAAWYCLAYGVPPTWAKGGQGRGMCTHHDLGPAGGGHIDICPVGAPLWTKALSVTQNIYAEMKALPTLPTWALNGAPGPHEVVAPPFVPTEPSHGGAARNEPGDIIDHPTPSKFAVHSIPALQADANALGAALDVDGGFGPKTEAWLRSFQATHGLVVDGQIGPASWAAISDALAKLPMPGWRT